MLRPYIGQRLIFLDERPPSRYMGDMTDSLSRLPSRRVFATLFFLSGWTSLVYELCFTRLLGTASSRATTTGSSTPSTASR